MDGDSIHGDSVQCAEQDLGRDWGGGQSRLVWIARGWSLLYVWVCALIPESSFFCHLTCGPSAGSSLMVTA